MKLQNIFPKASHQLYHAKNTKVLITNVYFNVSNSYGEFPFLNLFTFNPFFWHVKWVLHRALFLVGFSMQALGFNALTDLMRSSMEICLADL
jgi:hypothetical protein